MAPTLEEPTDIGGGSSEPVALIGLSKWVHNVEGVCRDWDCIKCLPRDGNISKRCASFCAKMDHVDGILHYSFIWVHWDEYEGDSRKGRIFTTPQNRIKHTPVGPKRVNVQNFADHLFSGRMLILIPDIGVRMKRSGLGYRKCSAKCFRLRSLARAAPVQNRV